MGLCSGVKFDTLDFGYNDMTEFIVLCMWIKHLNHTVPLSHQGLKLWDGGYPQVPSIQSTRSWHPRDYHTKKILLYEKITGRTFKQQQQDVGRQVVLPRLHGRLLLRGVCE